MAVAKKEAMSLYKKEALKHVPFLYFFNSAGPQLGNSEATGLHLDKDPVYTGSLRDRIQSYPDTSRSNEFL